MTVYVSAQPAAAAHRRRLSALSCWHLLSLDAPTVAALWTWFIAASVHLRLPSVSIAAMAVAVWMLYAADRLLDTRQFDRDPLHAGDLEQRHHFHHRHRFAFLSGIVAASVALAVLLPSLPSEALRIYLGLGSLLAAYFVLIHATASAHRLPKELAVGIFFAAAVFIPTVSRQPALRSALLPSAAFLALLCSLNCLFIYRWEHPPHSTEAAVPHPVTRLALRHLQPLAIVSLAANLLLASTLLARRLPDWVLPAACAVATALLLLLHARRDQLPRLTLRAAADLALLTPLLFLPAVLGTPP